MNIDMIITAISDRSQDKTVDVVVSMDHFLSSIYIRIHFSRTDYAKYMMHDGKF